MDPNLRYVEGQSQFGLSDILQQKSTTDFSLSSTPSSKYLSQSISSVRLTYTLY